MSKREDDEFIAATMAAMPSPQPITVGKLAQTIREMEKLGDPLESENAERRAAFLERHMLLNTSAGFGRFVLWANTVARRNADSGAVAALFSEASPRLGITFAEISLMQLEDVLSAIGQPTPSLIADIAEANQKPSKTASTRVSTRRSAKGESAVKILAAVRSLIAEKKWDATDIEIYERRAGVKKATFYHLLRYDKVVRKAVEGYRNTTR
jgi:hypothetical protein